MIRAHFVDIESHVLPLLVAHCPAWEQAQEQDAVQAHRPLAATWQVSYSTLHNPCCKEGQFISLWGTGRCDLNWTVCPETCSMPLISSQEMSLCPRHLHLTRDDLYDKWHKWRILCNVTPSMLKQTLQKIEKRSDRTVRHCVTTKNYNVFHQFYQSSCFLTGIKRALSVFICLLRVCESTHEVTLPIDTILWGVWFLKLWWCIQFQNVLETYFVHYTLNSHATLH